MKVTGRLTWNEELQFSVLTHNGHELILDSAAETGGTGPTPKELVPVSLGGCTGMDVISILKKMQQDVTRFEVVVEGEAAEEHPRRYIGYSVTFHVHGNDIEPEKVARAITLSRDRYCSVGMSLDPATPHSYYFTINDGEPVLVPEAAPDAE